MVTLAWTTLSMTETGRVDFSHFYNNRKVLVTGATGFIGTPLCSRLVENGAKFTRFLVRAKIQIRGTYIGLRQI